MELDYRTVKDPKTGETIGYKNPVLLYRHPFMSPVGIAILVFCVFFITILGVLINLDVQRGKLKVRTIKSVREH